MTFDATVQRDLDTVTIRLAGELDSRAAPRFEELVMAAVQEEPRRLVLLAHELTYLSSAGLRCLVTAHQKLPGSATVVLVGTRAAVADTIRMAGFDKSVVLQETTQV